MRQANVPPTAGEPQAAGLLPADPDDDLKPERVQFTIEIETADGTKVTLVIPSAISTVNLEAA